MNSLVVYHPVNTHLWLFIDRRWSHDDFLLHLTEFTIKYANIKSSAQ